MSIIILIMRRTLIPTTAVYFALLSSAVLTAGQNATPSGDSDKSLGDIARKVRPKDAKVTSQRVFTDEDVTHTPSTFVLQKAPTTLSLEELEKKVDEVESKTARQLGEEFVKDIQFPGRDQWEQDLYKQKEALVAATRNWIILKRSDKSTKDALDRAAIDQGIADRAYTDLQAKGIVEAAKWEKR